MILHKNVPAVVLSIVLSLFLWSCNKEDDQLAPVKKEQEIAVETLEAHVPDNGGVILKGELKGAEFIKEYGFYYSEDSTFYIISGVITYQNPTTDGGFEAEVNRGFNPTGVPYYYRAFINSVKGTFKGQIQPFKPNGNKVPVITKVVPSMGHIGDTIKIYGKYFSYSSVLLDGKFSSIIEKNDSIITCIVPAEIENPTPEVWVGLSDSKKRVDGLFSLYKPEIHSLSNSEGTFRDVIEIMGDHFDPTEAGTEVWFDNVKAKVAGVTRTMITVVVPDELQKSINEIKVNTQKQEALSPEKFEILSPSITFVPAQVTSGEEVIIEGENFHPISYRNEVFFGDGKAEIVKGGKNFLKVKVPNGPYPKKEELVKVQIFDLEGISSIRFSVEDTWRMISNSLPFSYYRSFGSFIINNVAYVIAPSKDYPGDIAYLWVFNPLDYSWEQRNIPANLNSYGIGFGNGTNGYLYTGTESSNFYEYYPTSDTWIAKPDFPGAPRSNPVSFALSGGVGIGLGINYDGWSQTHYTDFYYFDAKLNIWTKKNDFEGKDQEYVYRSLKEASVFIINDEAYVGGGGSDTGKTELWKYNVTSDSWVEMKQFHISHYASPAFAFNGKGYVLLEGAECWEYDPVANSWNNKPFPDYIWANAGGFAFVVNGIPYVGGGERRTEELYMLDDIKF